MGPATGSMSFGLTGTVDRNSHLGITPRGSLLGGLYTVHRVYAGCGKGSSWYSMCRFMKKVPRNERWVVFDIKLNSASRDRSLVLSVTV